MRIMMKDFSGLVKADNPRGIKKGILIGMLSAECSGYPPEPQTYNDVSRKGDWIYYIQYKDKQKDCTSRYLVHDQRRIMRITQESLKSRFLDHYDFRYLELLQAVEKLAYHDKIELGKEDIFLKERAFREIHQEKFFPY